MTDQLKASIVRIMAVSGTIVGAGFLVTEKHILTCAHVVAQALAIPEDTPEMPDGELRLDFPLVMPGKELTARVVFWRPIQPDISTLPEAGEDLAALELMGNPPDGSRAARLVIADDLWGHSFRAFGFPDGHDEGVWASGVLRDRQAGGWIQIEDLKATGYFVAPGFSGTPVWDEQVNGVVGMVIGAEKRSDVRAAFMISTTILVKGWSRLNLPPPCHELTIDKYEVIQLYLTTSFERDKYARLDQAGETDPDRTTLLRQVFVDLEVEPRSGPQPRRLSERLGTLLEERKRAAEELPPYLGERRPLSAMDCFLQEKWPMIVVIGGPGHGKSTLGQYLAQVHRATLLGREEEVNGHSPAGSKTKDREFVPKIPRVPFRVVLKYFAQWLNDRPRLDSVETYLVEQIEKDTSRTVSSEDVQEILRASPCLVIFDGLDEVIEPDLRSRLLARVEEFLRRADQLDANLQVLSTSRPTGYTDQFDPERFWHLELQPMSVQKVHDYARRWVSAKVPVEEEQRRVLETLAECQQEEHTRVLLSTPLQVTIVLLIIKDGGRPPAQREALFNEYWSTIFRREKAKAKDVIRTEESLLFDLHAYLGYLLHRRAAGENVRSLLPAAEFEKAVHGFLRGKDSHSSEDAIRQRAADMVSEARDRLVLLVEPEPGLFGFELRSLQEFFAAAYLAQTARDTRQRFDRLKAVARSEHWHNVSLFFSGRIVRSFGGEAANILELVCRPIDRDPADHYLRRGAWLALDVAADGAFAANRDLQYSALEYALMVLGTGNTRRNEQHLETALRRLSPEDQRDILIPLLQEKLPSLPVSCLAAGLDAYGRVGEANRVF